MDVAPFASYHFVLLESEVGANLLFVCHPDVTDDQSAILAPIRSLNALPLLLWRGHLILKGDEGTFKDI